MTAFMPRQGPTGLVGYGFLPVDRSLWMNIPAEYPHWTSRPRAIWHPAGPSSVSV